MDRATAGKVAQQGGEKPAGLQAEQGVGTSESLYSGTLGPDQWWQLSYRQLDSEAMQRRSMCKVGLRALEIVRGDLMAFQCGGTEM